MGGGECGEKGILQNVSNSYLAGISIIGDFLLSVFLYVSKFYSFHYLYNQEIYS